MEIKPENTNRLANARKKEFIILASKLKKVHPRKLDEQIHHLHHQVFSMINCLDCAACCKSLGPRITDNDIARLSKALRMRPSEFYTTFLHTDSDGDMVFGSLPCPFLQANNHCSVYENRPKACREYPHTDRPRFFQIVDLSVKNTPVCPAVYNIFDILSKTTSHG